MNFKNIFKKAPVLVLALILGSCNLLDQIKPRTSLTKEQAFQSIDDYDAALRGLYNSLKSSYGLNYYLLPEIMSDNVRDKSSLGNFLTFANWLYNPTNARVNSIFVSNYSTILSANVILFNIQDFVKTEEDQQVYNRIAGQAHAIRALAFFNLHKFFSESYDRNSNKMGVPLVETDGTTIIERAARSTVKETYDYIYADLKQAEKLLTSDLDEDVNDADSKQRLDIRGVYALRARVSQYAKDWADAINYSTKLIDEASTDGSNIRLANIQNADVGKMKFEYVDTFLNPRQTSFETIFRLAYLSGEGIRGRLPGDGDGYVLTESWNAAANATKNKPDAVDIRIYYSAMYKGKPKLAKLAGTGKILDGRIDVQVFRISEAYLIRAEAYQESGNETLALADLNTLRKARTSDIASTATGEALRIAIRNERRLELVCEGHRFFDLRRYKLPIERTGKDCTSRQINCMLEAGSHKFVLPIPLREIEVNKDITQSDQNPGY